MTLLYSKLNLWRDDCGGQRSGFGGLKLDLRVSIILWSAGWKLFIFIFLSFIIFSFFTLMSCWRREIFNTWTSQQNERKRKTEVVYLKMEDFITEARDLLIMWCFLLIPDVPFHLEYLLQLSLTFCPGFWRVSCIYLMSFVVCWRSAFSRLFSCRCCCTSFKCSCFFRTDMVSWLKFSVFPHFQSLVLSSSSHPPKLPNNWIKKKVNVKKRT